MATANETLKLYTAQVKPASGGFGMYETGEWHLWGNPEDYEGQGEPLDEAGLLCEWEGACAENGSPVERTAEIDGVTYNPGAYTYRSTDEDGTVRYQAVRVE